MRWKGPPPQRTGRSSLRLTGRPARTTKSAPMTSTASVNGCCCSKTVRQRCRIVFPGRSCWPGGTATIRNGAGRASRGARCRSGSVGTAGWYCRTAYPAAGLNRVRFAVARGFGTRTSRNRWERTGSTPTLFAVGPLPTNPSGHRSRYGAGEKRIFTCVRLAQAAGLSLPAFAEELLPP